VATIVKVPPDPKDPESLGQVFAAVPINGPIVLPLNVYETEIFDGSRVDAEPIICVKTA
jgi:hypothetical protein